MSNTFAPLDHLDGQVAVITGGTGAIAAATAQRLAHLGARVVLLHRGGLSKSEALLQSLPGSGHGALIASVTNSEELAKAAEDVIKQYGGAHILINTAGHTQPVPAADLNALTDELIDEMFVSNWRGTFAAIRAFAPQLKDSEDGLIVNVSSIAGTTGLGSNLAYAAGATIPLKRVGTADDVAAAIIACCTTMRYATGSIFVADGGRSL